MGLSSTLSPAGDYTITLQDYKTTRLQYYILQQHRSTVPAPPVQFQPPPLDRSRRTREAEGLELALEASVVAALSLSFALSFTPCAARHPQSFAAMVLLLATGFVIVRTTTLVHYSVVVK